MSPGTSRSAGRVLRRIPSTAVLAALGLVGGLTIVAAALSWWLVAITGLVLLHLGTALAVLGPWGARPNHKPPKDSSARITSHVVDLERRVDALSARLVASTERTRVELLDAFADRAGREGDRPS